MGRLGLILSQFPRYDEAFILREIGALSQGPQELVIFSLRPCRDRVVHAQAEALRPRTLYAPFLWSAEVWRSHAYFLRRSPGAYWSSLGWIISRHWNHPVILARTLILFPKTVHFARLALQHHVSHLHAFWATYPAASALLMSRLAGISYSLSGHAHDLYTTNPALAEKIRGSRFVVTCTEENKRYLGKLLDGFASWRVGALACRNGEPTNPPPPKADQPTASPLAETHQRTNIFVNYHGVDLSQFIAVPKPDGPVCRLLVVGSLFPCKGLETLVEACRLLKDRGVAFQCTMAGGGALERSLRRRIARHGLADRVEITGYVSQEVVVQLYQRAHLFVLPLISKIHWGIPNVLIEALATKTPVICCDLPSMRELVEHGTSGWIIPEENPETLADAIQTLWADAGLRQRLGDAGYRRVIERFSLERTGAQLRGLFAQVAVQEAAR